MARWTLTIDFDDRLDTLDTELAASLAVRELRSHPSITVERSELIDHYAVPAEDHTLACLRDADGYEYDLHVTAEEEVPAWDDLNFNKAARSGQTTFDISH